MPLGPCQAVFLLSPMPGLLLPYLGRWQPPAACMQTPRPLRSVCTGPPSPLQSVAFCPPLTFCAAPCPPCFRSTARPAFLPASARGPFEAGCCICNGLRSRFRGGAGRGHAPAQRQRCAGVSTAAAWTEACLPVGAGGGACACTYTTTGKPGVRASNTGCQEGGKARLQCAHKTRRCAVPDVTNDQSKNDALPLLAAGPLGASRSEGSPTGSGRPGLAGSAWAARQCAQRRWRRGARGRPRSRCLWGGHKYQSRGPRARPTR